MKHLLFDDNGDFKAGSVLSEAGASLQIELASGKRTKIKSAHVVLRFAAPAADALLPAARRLAEDIDVDFLWECAPQHEFGFDELARDYFGRAPNPVEATALLLRLHGAPVHFHRKGRGRFRPAPPETLKAAVAAIERRRLQEQAIEAHAQEMAAGRLPPEIAAQAAQLVSRPDRNSMAWKALERALALTRRTPERLLLAVGAFDSPRSLHVARFGAEFFPHGFGIVVHDQAFGDATRRLDALPLADADAFSIDDSTTTEIDDCLSVQPLPDGRWRVGVHIAAPGLAIPSGCGLDALARERMSTIYMPGEKVTMLPDEVIASFSLDAGRTVPALSLYVDLDPQGERVVSRFSRAERVRVVDNMRHDLLDGALGEDALDEDTLGGVAPIRHPHGEALRVLWRLTLALAAERERVRGKPEPRFRSDFNFYVDRADGDERVRIVQRRRDAPLDRIVAEMMILANSEWARMLADHGVPGVYRSQQAGRVKTGTHPLPHLGLGVQQYMWTTSPLRRYLDLVNQRQLLAVLAGEKPPFGQNDAELFSIISAFEARYAAYLEFQQRMERYWCLRWVRQEGLRRADAVAVRDDLVRLADAPLYFRLAGLPTIAPGRRIVVELLATDEVDLSIEARFVELGAAIDATAAEDAGDGEDALAEQAA
ncbi:MAG TPA: RNB domain-containing ribonuclease [Burkholderiaceae bacterium]|nr:RNB domain-containing ribonuclease [Burkholderiaceae bacterium]